MTLNIRIFQSLVANLIMWIRYVKIVKVVHSTYFSLDAQVEVLMLDWLLHALPTTLQNRHTVLLVRICLFLNNNAAFKFYLPDLHFKTTHIFLFSSSSRYASYFAKIEILTRVIWRDLFFVKCANFWASEVQLQAIFLAKHKIQF